jgi:hypothetical protein
VTPKKKFSTGSDARRRLTKRDPNSNLSSPVKNVVFLKMKKVTTREIRERYASILAWMVIY